MSFVVGSCVLKYIKSAKVTKKASIKEHLKGGGLPIIISLGRSANQLTLEGWFYNGSQLASLETSFINKLDNSLFKTVKINGPGTRHDGSYIFSSFEHSDLPANLRSIPFVMQFLKGSYHYVVT